jgi:DNA-binding CsgD family transcriptional regulator
MAELNPLSKREQEVLNLLLEGKSNKQIASSLSISERTVEFHLSNIYNKFQVGSRVELVLKLGESTVADKGEVAEDEERLNASNWALFLRDAVSEIGKEINMTEFLKADDYDEEHRMTFFGAVRTCLSKYATFHGRATRPEFWWFALFVILVTAALTYLSEALGSAFLVLMLLPLLAAGARRLHDTDRSGWWQLFLLVPFGGIVIVGSLWAVPSAEKSPDEPC